MESESTSHEAPPIVRVERPLDLLDVMVMERGRG